jgi:hypothetical protein
VSAPDQEQASTDIAAADAAAIAHLQQAVAEGREWQVALLEAIGLWVSPEEMRDGHVVRYLIDGEALDWLVLAERLCETVVGLVPEDDRLGLLFHGRLPVDISPEMFRDLIGSPRHHQYLNYFYGITVTRRTGASTGPTAPRCCGVSAKSGAIPSSSPPAFWR